MSLFRTKILCLSVMSIFSTAAMADDFFIGSPANSDDASVDCEQSAEACDAKWNGGVELGYVAVSGNKDTRSFNAQLSLGYEVEKWRHEGAIASVTSSSDSTDSSGNLVQSDSEKLNIQAKSNYKYSSRAYAFGLFDYDKTKDSGFDYQGSMALGGGYSFLSNDAHKLNGELGFGSRKSKTDATLTVASNTSSESITRLAGLYKWVISENSEFEQKISAEIGSDNTITKSYSGLSANLMEDLALKLSYLYKHQSDVPVNNAKTESITSFTVVYSF